MLATALSAESPNATKSRKGSSTCDSFDPFFHTPSLFSDNIQDHTSPTSSSCTYDLFPPDVCEEFNRLVCQSSSPQEPFLPNLGMVTDLESSGTPSPKDELFDPLFNSTSIFPYSRKSDLYRGFPNFRLPATSWSAPKDGAMKDIDSMSPDTLRFRLKDATKTIQNLTAQVRELTLEQDKHRQTIAGLQATVSAKDVEIQSLTHRLMAGNAFNDALSERPSNEQNDGAIHQSSVKSSCGLSNRDSLSIEQRITVLAKENSELKLKHLKFTQDLESEHRRTEFKDREIQQLRAELHSVERRASLNALVDKMSAGASNTSGDLHGDLIAKLPRRWSEERTPSTTGSGPEKRYCLTAVEYRRMLDKNVNADWKALVDRIIQETDQQASIFLQQKLKCSTFEQKESIFRAVLSQSHALMTNRFGNFLVQRLLELGTQEQIKDLADTMMGHVLKLTCEPFGCHVVQKALDCVDEHTKTQLVQELFERIPETIVHKYACHVWQKVFEIRWLCSPPGVMAKVHEALQGQWAQVALDETGSLVIQNIFENLTESEKRPVLNEVMENIVTIAKGQWGNWVVQHILEQAEKSSDRERAFQIVLNEAVQLSMDQFASKVVEKALRIGDTTFVNDFIDRISTTNRSHRPRMALIDIASDQYGNYVVQWLINNAAEEHKITLCRSIKRHMVSLRGSKYGQRVAFLVEKIMRQHDITVFPPTPSHRST